MELDPAKYPEFLVAGVLALALIFSMRSSRLHAAAAGADHLAPPLVALGTAGDATHGLPRTIIASPAGKMGGLNRGQIGPKRQPPQ